MLTATLHHSRDAPRHTRLAPSRCAARWCPRGRRRPGHADAHRTRADAPRWGRVAVTVSVRRMSLGAGYRYLMSSVARGDGDGRAVSALTRYYAQSGTPPGRFAGAGLAGLADGVGVEAGVGGGGGGVAADAGRPAGPGHRPLPGPAPAAAFPVRRRERRGARGGEAGGGVRPDVQRPEVGQRRVGPRRRPHPGGRVRGAPGRGRARAPVRRGAGVLLEGRARPAPPRSTWWVWWRRCSTTGTPARGTRSCTPTSWSSTAPRAWTGSGAPWTRGRCSGPRSRSASCTTGSSRTTSPQRWGGGGSRSPAGTRRCRSTKSPGCRRCCGRSSRGGRRRSRTPRTSWSTSSPGTTAGSPPPRRS